MRADDVRRLPSMPLQSPTYPRGPFRFFDRQYLTISYRTDPAAIRAALPEPLEPEGDVVAVQWLDLPDGEGFGAYAATAQTIPCTFAGRPCVFVSQMYVDNAPPLAGGREIWGYPMKFGRPKLAVRGDTLAGELEYAGMRVATGTMVYKHDEFRPDPARVGGLLARTQVTLKVIPDVDQRLAVAQLVAVEFEDVVVKGCWSGAARLELVANVNAPLADLPVLEAKGGLHAVTDLTLPYGRVLHDYLA